jgi:hypothetical protein
MVVKLHFSTKVDLAKSHNKAFWTWTRQISEGRREIVQWLESGMTYSIPVLLY